VTNPKSNPDRLRKCDLCRRLKLHRATLDAWLAKAGAPAPDKKKTYVVTDVVQFIAHNRDGGSLDSLRAARLREVQLRCEKLSRELDLAARQVVTLETFHEQAFLMSRFMRDALIFKLTTELPPKLAGMTDVAEIRKALRDASDDVLRRFLAKCEQWEKDYKAGADLPHEKPTQDA
jgi:hypothetical protein